MKLWHCLDGQANPAYRKRGEMRMKDDAYAGVDLRGMTPGELMNAATYCNSWRNRYCEELCRRTGNTEAYENDPMKAAQAAARGFGSELI